MQAPNNELLECVERCILAFERDGEEGLSAELIAAGPLSALAKEHIDALRQAGLLNAPECPERIGTWHVRKRLGSGGMGSVFLGEQTEPIARRGAIKVIRAGMDSHEVLARFAMERQALALLDHPGIARILDAGRTENGRPFLVMEYVAGQPICRYCDERQLDTRARLQLFAQVCDAVQHAHHKGLLHRDLKPSNILVGERNGAPMPVVIDFGVAKSVGAPLGRSLLTLPGRLLGTPEYMSPEQARNETDVDTRTDVYSLGVVLYELLTSTLPIEGKALRAVDSGHSMHTLDPATPSTRITSLGDEAEAIASRRRTSVGGLQRTLRGDLDWIVMKALERDRNRRYGMPGELAADVRRHLANEAVTAGAPGTWYRFRKFCARNRLEVAAGGIVLVALTVGLLASMRFHRAAVRGETAASQGLDAAMAAIGELVAVGDHDLVAVPHLEGIRRDLLRRAVVFYREFLATSAADDPRVLGRMLDATWRVAHIESDLGEPEQALRHLDEYQRLLSTPTAATLTPQDRSRRAAHANLESARLFDRMGQLEQAARCLDSALVTLRADAGNGGEQDLLRLANALALAAALAVGLDPTRSLALIDEAIALELRTQRDPRSEQVLVDRLRWHGDRANFLRLLGRRDETLAEIESMMAMRKDHPARGSWSAANAAIRISTTLDSLERPDAAMQLSFELTSIFEQLVEDHPAVVAYRRALLSVLNTTSNSFLLQKEVPMALSTLQQMEDVCVAGLAVTPGELALTRHRIISCINMVTVRDEQRRLNGEWDLAAAEAALARAAESLATIPAGAPRREVRPHHMELLRLRAQQHEMRADLPAAGTDLGAAVAIAEELIAEAPDVVEWRTRATEMLRRQAAVLFAQRRWQDAHRVIERTLALSSSLRDVADAQQRWLTRHREILLLTVQARALVGEVDGAFAALAEHEAIGPGGPADTLDWIGKQEAGAALAKVVAALPTEQPARARFLAKGRDVLAAGLAFGQRHLENGANPTMVAVMRGNSLVVARDLETAAGDLAAAANRAREIAEAFVLPFRSNGNQRNETRLQKALATWVLDAARSGDATATAAAAQAAIEWLADRPVALAEMAAATAAVLPAIALRLLQQARAVGLASATVLEERFAPLRTLPGFAELAPPPGKQ